MSRSRSLWLWSPLVVLTVFFGVLGWRNNHLSMSEDDVLLAIPDYRTSTGIMAPVDLMPFGDGQRIVLGRGHTEVAAKPLAAALTKRFMGRYPHIKFLDFGSSQHTSNTYVNFGPVEFKGRFSARCRAAYSCVVRDISHVDATLYLTRSPIDLRDNEWHVVNVGKSRF